MLTEALGVASHTVWAIRVHSPSPQPRSMPESGRPPSEAIPASIEACRSARARPELTGVFGSS